MTRVLLDARNITDRPAGVARYALALIPKLVELRPDWDWCVLRHQSNREPIAQTRAYFSDVRIDGWKNYRRGAREFRAAARELGAPDIVHGLFHLLPRKLEAPAVVVTAHDFIWIDHPEISQSTSLGAFATATFAKRAIPETLRRADRVIAVSPKTAAEATRWVDASKTTVIPHGVATRYFDPPPPPDVIVDFLRSSGRYIVAVGNSKQYKNLQTLIRAFARMRDTDDLRLALIGNCDPLLEVAEEHGVADRVTAVGFVDDVDLRRIVGHASLFVFPSLVEGFGMPPLEAMALGVPTIVSDLEPMSWVAGDAALRFRPTDMEALATLMSGVLADATVASALSEAGRRRAGEFDWEIAARDTIAVYEDVLGQE